MVVRDKKFFYIFLFTAEPFLVLVSFIILIIMKKPFTNIFICRINPVLQAVAGIGFGVLIAVPCVLFIYNNKIFSDVMDIFDELIGTFGLKIPDFIIVSAVAGICEEILFRATLQPMFGVWLTSFIFILLHGYFNPKNWKIFLFGSLMFLISVLIGLVYIWLGLYAAIVFHFTYDFLALFLVSFTSPKSAD